MAIVSGSTRNGHPAANASVYKDDLRLMYWCDICNPDPIGIQSGSIQIIETYVVGASIGIISIYGRTTHCRGPLGKRTVQLRKPWVF